MIAVAGGPAFTFCYTELGELLTAAGARIAVFDPVTDRPAVARRYRRGGHRRRLPRGTCRRTIGQYHFAATAFGHAKSGGPIWAECAGLLYLDP